MHRGLVAVERPEDLVGGACNPPSLDVREVATGGPQVLLLVVVVYSGQLGS